MAYSGPCYSPSRGGTQDFQRCPRLFDYTQRWSDPRGWSPEIAMGNAIHAGLAEHYGKMWAAPGLLKGMAVSDAIWLAFEEWQGEGIGRDKAMEIGSDCFKAALDLDVLGKTGKVLAVEQEMGPEKCHPDLVIRHDQYGNPPWDQGGLIQTLEVVDWKFSYHLMPEWVSKRLASYETSWQLKHYAWRVQQEFGLPCTKTTVVQMAATPKPKAWSQSFEITPESLAAWEVSAISWWNQMSTGPYPQNYEGCRKYGENHLCPFYRGCHTLHGDESKFGTLYKRREG